MASIILKRGDGRVQSHPLADLRRAGEALEADECATERAETEDVAPEPHETTIEVLRQGGVTTAIEVRCGCGEVTVIEFDYAAETAQASDDAPDAGGSES